jgi:CRP-like cAMP-binding protein
MGQQGRSVSVDIQLTIVRLSVRNCKEDIATYVDLSVRTVQRVLNYFHKHGTVKGLDPKAILNRHSPRKQLSGFNLNVSMDSWINTDKSPV